MKYGMEYYVLAGALCYLRLAPVRKPIWCWWYVVTLGAHIHVYGYTAVENGGGQSEG